MRVLILFALVSILMGASIVDVEAKRALFMEKEDLLEIYNCPLPGETKLVKVLLEVDRPEGCEGGFEVYMSYYDFAADGWSKEEFLCRSNTGKRVDCDRSIPLTLGGTEPGEHTYEWLRLRYVCEEGEVIETLSPTFRTKMNNIEKDRVDRIARLEEEIEGARADLAACGCCEDLEAQLEDVEEDLEAVRQSLQECDFDFIDELASMEERVASIKEEIKGRECPTEGPSEETQEEQVEESGVEEIPQNPEKEESKGGVCALPIAILSLVFLRFL